MLASWPVVLSIALALAVPWPTLGDDLRVHQLENEVLRLQLELAAQSRRIDQLERTARNAAVSQPIPGPSQRSDDSPAWLVATNWDRVRPGMSELDVVVLGRPTSVRTKPDGKFHTLFYALELGPTAILTGNVRLDDSGVTDITKPTLR